MTRIVFSILFVCFLISCSPEQRLARMLKKYPELIKHDTVWKKDTITVFGTKTDTIIQIWQKDTVIIKNDQLTMKYYMRSDSTIYLEGECDTITIIREIPISVNSVTATIEELSFFEKWGSWILMVLLLVYLIILKLKR